MTGFNADIGGRVVRQRSYRYSVNEGLPRAIARGVGFPRLPDDSYGCWCYHAPSLPQLIASRVGLTRSRINIVVDGAEVVRRKGDETVQ
jgi:hypothetical protein